MRRLTFLFLFALAAAAASGCQPATKRPTLTPFPEAATVEVRLVAAEATRRLAEALRADSIPVTRVEQRDAYLETGWFNQATGQPTGRRTLGQESVRVRAWVERSRPYSSRLIVETVYRPLADPSLPERELERPVAKDHPIAVKIRATLEAMVKKFGGTSGSEGTNS